MRNWVIAALLASATGAAAQTGTAQQAYNAAEAAAAKGDWPAAAEGYRTALKSIGARTRSAAVIHSRLANALFDQGGHLPDAREAAATAAAQFRALGVTQDEDLAEADLLLGAVGRFELDRAAVSAYRDALTAAAGAGKAQEMLNARIGIALASMTGDPAAAARALDEALADPGFAALPKAQQADLLSQRARAELNRGDAKAAAGFSKRAVALVGRDTTRVTINQVQIRGDAALIEAKLGDEEGLRHDLTYSGAGHLTDNSWLTHQHGALPLCGGDIRPDDVAVVQFAISDAGRVQGAAAVYASRPGEIGDTFARAVRDWRWSPDSVRKLNGFWRAAVRIELRCVTRPAGTSLGDVFRDDVQNWLAGEGVTLDLTDPALTPADVTTATPAGEVARKLLAMRDNDKSVTAADLSAALDAAQAPAGVRAYMLLVAAHSDQALDRAVATVQKLPDGARPAAWLRVQRALRAEQKGDLNGARASLAAVDALPTATLAADDPIRTLALLHLALIDQRTGHPETGNARLTAAGVSADQCSLLDVQPVATNMAVSSSTFPSEAMRWGFEGSVREAFDINADGSVAGVRTVIAYPPLVFGPATERAVRRFRYAVPTLDGKAVGCAAHTQNVVYKMPR